MDPLSFPVLAGSALTQAFGFLFGRLSHVLDRKDQRRDEQESIDTPAVIDGQLGPLTQNHDVVDTNLAELREIAGILGVYERNPDRLDTNDDVLRENMGRLRFLLEQIYGKHITFQGEDRPKAGVTVEQRIDSVSGQLTGVSAQRVRQAGVRQDVNQVQEGSSVIGIQGDEIG